MKFNPEQRAAIQEIHHNVALVAGAGTGKTAVLTERYMELLKRGDLPSGEETNGIVAITFTEKAADEMKMRIQNRLQESQASYAQPGRGVLKIATIHSFCARILRDDPAGAGIDPAFMILDEGEAQAMLYHALEQAYITCSKKVDAEMLCERAWFEHGGFLSDVAKLYGQLRAGNADRNRVRNESTRFTGWTSDLDTALKNSLTAYMENASKSQKLRKFLEEEENRLLLEDQTENRERLVRRLMEMEEPYGTARDAQRVKEVVLRCAAASENHFTDALHFLFDLLDEAGRIYRTEKDRKAALDYDDLQEKVLLRLQDPKARRALQEEIRYLMVDECQDINEVQKEIFYGVCSREKPLDRKNLFVVGDPRQSIYGFRYARAALFDTLQEDIRASGGRVLQMRTNYRCSEPIIDYVNQVFRPHFPGLEELQAHGESPHIGIYWCASENEEAIGAKADAMRVREKVAQLLQRDFQPGDIGLLFRSSARMDIYENALKHAGIPCINLSSTGLWHRPEVTDLLAAALVATGLADDIWWLAYLRSPFAGISDKDLLQWKAVGENWENRLIAQKYTAKKAEQVLEQVRGYRDFLAMHSVPELIEQLRKKYDVYCAGEPDAERRLANLDIVSHWLWEEWKQNADAPEELVRMWRERCSIEEEEAEQADAGEGSVTLMTIHKAKGLEKRVIFLIGVDAYPYRGTDSFLYDENRVQFRGSARHALASNRQRAREDREELRILYVALTRAKEALILTSQTGRNQNFRKMLADAGFCPTELPAMPLHKNETEKGGDPIPAPFPGRPYHFPSPPMQTAPFSASQWMRFLLCKRAWYLRYRLGIKPYNETTPFPTAKTIEEKWNLSGLEKGSFVHLLLESDRGEDADRYIRSMAEAQGFTPSVTEIRRFTQWLQTVRDYPFQGELSREVSFDWERNGYLWTGSVDLMEEGPVLRIYDFKTNRDKEDLVQYYPQMQFYALAMEALTDKIPEAYLWWLPKDQRYSVDTSPAALERTRTALDHFTTYVTENTGLDAYPPRTDCNENCNYKALCQRLS